MAEPYRILALIPARSGSKGLRHKNLRKLAGKPLMVHAIELAQGAGRRDESWRIVVSTDSRHYGRVARRAGAEVPFIRPPALATDESRLTDVVAHALSELEGDDPFDAVLLLSATTPLTEPQDVRRALTLFRRGEGASVASVVADPTAASWRFELVDDRLDRRPRRHRVGRRQEDRPKVILNGALYVASPRWLRRHGQFVRAGETLPLLMPAARSLDVESAWDLKLAELVSRSRE